MIYYAVIDTNVLVSALLTRHEDAAPLQVVKKMLQGEIIPLYHPEILQEYANVLWRPRFNFSEETVALLIESIIQFGIPVDRFASEVKLVDSTDQVFYEVTMTKQRDDNAYLITGNLKHYPAESFIVTPPEMLRIINGE